MKYYVTTMDISEEVFDNVNDAIAYAKEQKGTAIILKESMYREHYLSDIIETPMLTKVDEYRDGERINMMTGEPFKGEKE